MIFVELKTEDDWCEAYPLIKELTPDLTKKQFIEVRTHALSIIQNLFGIRVNDELVSIASTWSLVNSYSEKILWIYGFVTKKGMRSKSYGSNLVRYIEQYAKNNGYDQIRVHTTIDRVGAKEFWQNKLMFRMHSYVLEKKL
jgi:GNAT superfamily N-acetyltransferase